MFLSVSGMPNGSLSERYGELSISLHFLKLTWASACCNIQRLLLPLNRSLTITYDFTNIFDSTLFLPSTVIIYRPCINADISMFFEEEVIFDVLEINCP
jgi:hypothetical protein